MQPFAPGQAATGVAPTQLYGISSSGKRAAFPVRRRSRGLQGTPAGAAGQTIKVCFISREYPPHVYGGAGVHVRNLTRELAQLMDVEVRCFGDQDLTHGRLRVKGYQPWDRVTDGSEKKFS